MTDWLYDSGDAVLATAKLAVDTAHAGDIASFVSLGKPVAVPCDRLSINLQNLQPDAGSQRQMASISGCSPGLYPTLVGNWEIQLWRSCYPSLSVQNDTILLPELESLVTANTDLYAQAQALYAAIIAGYAEGFPDLPACVDKVTFGALAPLEPQGKMAGWKVPVVIEYGSTG